MSSGNSGEEMSICGMGNKEKLETGERSVALLFHR